MTQSCRKTFSVCPLSDDDKCFATQAPKGERQPNGVRCNFARLSWLRCSDNCTQADGTPLITTSNHRHQLHGLLSPRTATLELTADIGCSECFRFRYVTNVKALIVPRSKSMRSHPDNGVKRTTEAFTATTLCRKILRELQCQ